DLDLLFRCFRLLVARAFVCFGFLRAFCAFVFRFAPALTRSLLFLAGRLALVLVGFLRVRASAGTFALLFIFAFRAGLFRLARGSGVDGTVASFWAGADGAGAGEGTG